MGLIKFLKISDACFVNDVLEVSLQGLPGITTVDRDVQAIVEIHDNSTTVGVNFESCANSLNSFDRGGNGALDGGGVGFRLTQIKFPDGLVYVVRMLAEESEGVAKVAVSHRPVRVVTMCLMQDC